MRPFWNIFFLTLALATTGCAAIKKMVCDCEKQVSTCNEPLATANAPIMQVSREQGDNENRNTFVAPKPGEGADLDPIDPANKDAILDVQKDEKRLTKRFGTKPVAAFRGDFGGKKGKDYVGISDDGVKFVNGSWKAEFPVDTVAKPNELPKMNLTPFAGELVKDGDLELVAFVVDTKNATQRTYRMQVYKVIGERVGLVFDEVFGVKTAKGYTQIARIDFVEGVHHRRIRFTPMTEDGLLDLPGVQLFVWNKWEGMFRIPKRAPTAPN